MAGRIANKEPDAIFHPYSKVEEPKKHDRATADGKDGRGTSKTVTAQDNLDRKESLHHNSKKGKKAKGKSGVGHRYP
jgi:hypothetical protein